MRTDCDATLSVCVCLLFYNRCFIKNKLGPDNNFKRAKLGPDNNSTAYIYNRYRDREREREREERERERERDIEI